MEKKFGDDVLLCDGPALSTGGFFYDALIRKELSAGFIAGESMEQRIQRLTRADGAIYNVTQDDMKDLEGDMKAFGKKKSRFTRLVVPRTVAERLFQTNPFKLYFLSRIPEEAPVTLYRCGDFIDLCRGPHVPHTGYLRANKLLRTAGAQWETGHAGAHQPLSRVYGIAFPNADDLKHWQHVQEEAAKRDHRLIGKQQGLFIMNPMSPGSPFMLPHGTRIMQRLMDFLRAEYRRYGYQEVITPLLFNKELWVTSGHWENYKEDMFVVNGGSHDGHGGCCGSDKADDAESETHGLKPMNCPGHCLLYASSAKSYRDLPVRLAEFSPVHRNEASGALTGLTRVRKFHQDDAHIFCRPAQIGSEISATLSFIHRVYSIFQFPSYHLTLATRPTENFMGTKEQWDSAEAQLRTALSNTGREWTVKEGDGAFYGPKIDIMVKDALGRAHQTATIQLDFQLPQRFQLKYQAEDGGFETPVIVHRAILGSVERMMAVLIEHYAGKWPFWLSPRQAMVVPVGMDFVDYARKVAAELSGKGLPPPPASGQDIDANGKHPTACWHVDVDETDHLLSKRIREAQTAQYNFMLVVGAKERDLGKVTVRQRDGKDLGMMDLHQVRELFTRLEAKFL
ncbi:uncharacterized protein EV422DRAFT_567127 [Fimicolochytrium jonesii]|uniref:uncharacterized protein n=1 Tax=Fimicolochytrium jonesii TaxID=1396493 RepID=UPI0022FE1FF5|nr:uncharacterized protein EV422DRAFT_567127 [Fimicolochytrium jonesii]KAI8821386.1 hypothetical protein EV422DRAFT_567127 [Fimicolochytrium jonesii]